MKIPTAKEIQSTMDLIAAEEAKSKFPKQGDVRRLLDNEAIATGDVWKTRNGPLHWSVCDSSFQGKSPHDWRLWNHEIFTTRL